MNSDEIISFKCKICGSIIEKGFCGKHRNQTGHEDFEQVYEASNE